MTNFIPSDKIRNHYDEVIKNSNVDYIYGRWGDMPIKRHHYKQTEKALLNEFSKIDQIGDVLEIGCGPAVWTNLYLDKARYATLLDISEEMLVKARERIGEREQVKYICGDFNEVKLPDDLKYDMIVSFRAWEYMSNKSNAVQRCYNLLKPGAKLVIVTKNRSWLDNRHRLNKKDVNISKLSVSEAMQMDLIAWQTLNSMYEEVGFNNIVTYPVVIGSYNKLFNWTLGLIACDIFHKGVYTSPISKWYETLVESYLTVGTKPL